MKRSTDRILTSHVGTLPPPKDLSDLRAEYATRQAEYEALLPEAVRAIVRKQAEIGLDVVNDGEFGKVGGFSNYVRERLAGYETRPLRSLVGREQQQLPEYSRGRVGGPDPQESPQMVCVGPVSYIGQKLISRDIDNLKAALDGVNVQEAFMAAVGPDNVGYQPGQNAYFATEDEYVQANADAMRAEYRAIVDAGFVLQIDTPVMKYNALSLSVDDFRARFARLVEILNHALEGIPPDRIRIHICYGGMKIAHTGDINLNQFIDLVLKINAAGISYDGNVRHEHEWKIWQERKLPDGKLLMPGVVAHTTDVVEHPELIADRITRLAKLVGRENVIAGTDCGLGGRVHPEIAWAKFRSMVEGAQIATKELWGKG